MGEARQIFRIVAIADPQALPRVVGLFAQRSLVPASIRAQRNGQLIHIDLTLDGIDPATAAILTAKLGEGMLIANVSCHSVVVTDPAAVTAAPTTAAPRSSGAEGEWRTRRDSNPWPLPSEGVLACLRQPTPEQVFLA